MQIVSDYRASAILYNFISSNDKYRKTWIIPTNVCHFVAATILKAGADIEIIDVDKQDLCLDSTVVCERLKSNLDKYSGIIYVRAFGILNNADAFFSDIKKIKENILLVDDKCLSIPSTNNDFNSLVDMELYSTGYSKYVDLGYGGFAKLNNCVSYKKQHLDYNEDEANIFAEFFKTAIYENRVATPELIYKHVNSNWLKSEKLNTEKYFKEINIQLPKVKKHKIKINNSYDKNLPENVKISPDLNIWRYNIKVKNRNAVLSSLNNKNLFASKHYYPLSILFDGRDCPIWENIFINFINLFNDLRYTESQARNTSYIIEQLEQS